MPTGKYSCVSCVAAWASEQEIAYRELAAYRSLIEAVGTQMRDGGEFRVSIKLEPCKDKPTSWGGAVTLRLQATVEKL